MNHQELKNFILETYPASADHPWLQYPNYEVFRHNSNQKWFAVVMELPKSKLGLQGEERMDVVNLKCDPILTGSLLTEKGFFPRLSHAQGQLDHRRVGRHRVGGTIKAAP